jgi:hypothetical protein
MGSAVAVPTAEGAVVYDVDAGTTASLSSGAEAALPQAIAFWGADLVVASPEWTEARLLGAGPVAAHGVFDLADVMDASLWRVGVPRRLLVSTSLGLAEVATLGATAGLALHDGTTETMALPPGTYVGGDASGDRLYLAVADRGSYRSQIVTVALDGAGPILHGVDAFTGVASGVAVDGDRLYVADADRGVRVYDLSGEHPQPLGVVELEQAP